MKQILTALLLVFSIASNAQIASRLLPSQAHPQPINAHNIVWVDTVAGGQQRIWVADRDSLKLYTFQIRGVKDSVQNWGDTRYPQLTATYFNPTFIGSIAANKLTGLNAPMISSALGYVPADSVVVAGKLNIPTGSNSQVVLGNGTLGALPPVIDTASLSGRINAKLSVPTISNSVARTLNSNFTISSTKMAFVSYSVMCSATNPLLAGSSTATAFLEYSTNGGSSWQTVSQQSATSSVALAVAVAITQAQTAPISGWIPANALVRIRTTTTGTASVAFVYAQETVF